MKLTIIVEIVVILRTTLLQLNWLCRLSDKFNTAIIFIELDLLYILYVFNEQQYHDYIHRTMYAFTETNIQAISYSCQLSQNIDHFSILSMSYNVKHKFKRLMIILNILNYIAFHFKCLHHIKLSLFKLSKQHFFLLFNFMIFSYIFTLND